MIDTSAARQDLRLAHARISADQDAPAAVPLCAIQRCVKLRELPFTTDEPVGEVDDGCPHRLVCITPRIVPHAHVGGIGRAHPDDGLPLN